MSPLDESEFLVVCSHILFTIMLHLHFNPLRVPPATVLRGEFVRVASICKNDVI